LGDAATADNFIGRFLMSGQVSSESLWLAVRIARGMGDRSREATYVAQLKRRFPDSREARVALDQR
jgi:type IV pilus assembly protein PilF